MGLAFDLGKLVIGVALLISGICGILSGGDAMFLAVAVIAIIYAVADIVYSLLPAPFRILGWLVGSWRVMVTVSLWLSFIMFAGNLALGNDALAIISFISTLVIIVVGGKWKEIVPFVKEKEELEELL